MNFTTTSYIPVIIKLSLLFLYCCSSFKSAIIGQNVVTIKICWIPFKTLRFPPKHFIKIWGLFTLSLKSNHWTAHPNTLYLLLPYSLLYTLVARTAEPPPSSPPSNSPLTMSFFLTLPYTSSALTSAANTTSNNTTTVAWHTPDSIASTLYLFTTFSFCFFIKYLSWVFGFSMMGLFNNECLGGTICV